VAVFVLPRRFVFCLLPVLFDLMRLRALGLLLLSAACSAAPAKSPAYRPSEVTELSELPEGYSVGDELKASCRKTLPAQAFADEALDNVDCNFARLSRVLRARAGELSAKVIFGKSCRGRGRQLDCSARVALPGSAVPFAAPAVGAGRPAPSPAEVQDLDEPRPQDAERVRVGFRPSMARSLPARSYDAVAETAWPSVGRGELGQVSARCETGCSDSALRHALRVTAAHVGAGEVSRVACFAEGEGRRCVAIALVPWSS
jgi:hypothetical protein